jgi:uncharacterized protein (DUF2147 family)
MFRNSFAALAAACLLFSAAARAADPAPSATPAGAAASPVGLWRTVSDVDGKAKAYVRLREENGVISGVIETILNPAKKDEVCEQCDGPRHNQRVQGMTFVTGMRRDGDHWKGGDILDPDNGHVYSCKMSLSEDGRQLKVRGFLGFSLLGRTQTWYREE